jgi:hypothetical protein
MPQLVEGAPASRSGGNRRVGSQAVNLFTEFPTLGVARTRNSAAMPYAAPHFNPLRRPFYQSAHAHYEIDGSLTLPPTRHGGTSGPQHALNATSPTPIRHRQMTGTLTAGTDHRELTIPVSATPPPTNAAGVTSRVPTAVTPMRPRHTAYDDDGGTSTRVPTAAAANHLQLTMNTTLPRTAVCAEEIPPSLGPSGTPRPYGNAHQAHCDMCRLAATKAFSDAEQRLATHEIRHRDAVHAKEAEARASLHAQYLPLHHRFKDAERRRAEALDSSRRTAHLKQAVRDAEELENAQRRELLREALRLQRAILRCAVRVGTERIADAEAETRAELAHVLQEEEDAARKAEAQRLALLASVGHRVYNLETLEQRRRGAILADEFRTAVRLTLTYREQRERNYFEAMKRREGQLAKDRVEVEKDQDFDRAELLAQESDERATLRTTVADMTTEFRARAHVKRRDDLQARESAGRLMKSSALLQEFATLFLTRVCPANETEIRKLLRAAEADEREAIAQRFADALAAAESQLLSATGQQEHAHRLVAREIAVNVLFAWRPQTV